VRKKNRPKKERLTEGYYEGTSVQINGKSVTEKVEVQEKRKEGMDLFVYGSR